MTDVDWLEAKTPLGALPPRARVQTDAPTLDLGGEWDFAYTPRRGADPEPWTTIAVPGCWQLQGHGAPVYLSAQLPFAMDPPHVPDENATGTYRRSVDVPEGFTRAVLRCDGIDSTGEVRVDGELLGWTKGSRLTHEFAVSLAPGRHEVEIRVAQYSATSYVEDQDMFWLSGIVRGVELVARPARGIDDLAVVADYDAATGRGRLELAVASDAPVTATLDGRPVAVGASDVGEVDPWSAELPRLYELVVSTPAETLTLRVGFRRVEIVDGIVRVNGAPVRFRGVNRHDTDPDHGRTVTHAQVREDLVAMKRANINAVRTSHYPPLPYLLDLADELGLYVVEENDIETHAFTLDDWRRNPSDDPDWTDAYVDRTRRMVCRDRNHPSVVVWSLGNEAGPGQNFGAARRWLDEHDPTRPVHYERDPSYADSDFYSVMYPELDLLERMATGQEGPPDKPILLCEYAHAMGAGPGGLSEYEALIETYPRIAGGFVWEWSDHTLRLPNGRLGYGGDFGEPLHDGAFAADGLHHGDGTAKPGLADYAAVVAPVRLTVADSWDAVTVRNRHDHADLSAVRLTWAVETSVGRVAAGELEVPGVGPGESVVLAVPAGSWRTGRAVLTVAAVTRDDSLWAAAGHEVAVGQAAVGMDRGELPVPGGAGSASFDSLGGLVSVAGTAVLGPQVGLWRAATDNDWGLNMRRLGQRSDEEQWREANLAHLSRRTGELSRDATGLTVETWTAPYSRSFGVHATHRWTPVADGVGLDVDVVPYGDWPCPWARSGLDWVLPGESLSTPLRWQGRGPGRAGSDVGQAARWGWFSATVADWQVHHARPQDDGVRSGVTSLELDLADGRTLRVDSREPLWVSVRPWSDVEVAAAEHPDELGTSDQLVLSLSTAVHGYGTGACGPGVLPAHVLSPGPYSMQLAITVR